MKKLIATIAVPVFSVLAAYGLNVINIPGPATVDLSAITQGQLVAHGKTNVTDIATNISAVETVSFHTSRFTSATLLTLIENSFHTNFPTGSQIGLSPTNFLAVVDHTGTNIIFPLDSVITSARIINTNSETITNFGSGFIGFISWHGAEIDSVTTNGASYTSNETSGGTYFGFSFTYDDTNLTPADNNHSQFQFTGLQQNTLIVGKTRIFTKVLWEIQGTGGGMVDGVETLLTGRITGKTGISF